MKKILLFTGIVFSLSAFSQMPDFKKMGGGQNFNIGHFYGKVIDSKTNKGLEGATLSLVGSKYDTAKKKMTQVTLKALVTESNGDFNMENLPVMGNFTLNISAIGYKPYSQKISFGMKMSQGGGIEGGREQMMSMVDKDLGNIKMEPSVNRLGEVTVTSNKQLFEMGIDRKIFNVDKNLTSTGQTAVEVMKSIPSLSVDIDGNVTMRNATPQLFIDNRPTTMTLDQIPADIIEKVELITNPSAKYDASGGNAGILNIVLKKNKKTGYNGGLRTGVDSRGKINIGGDINFRLNKFNFFAAGNYGQRKSISNTLTDRTDYMKDSAISNVYQVGNPINVGSFRFIRTGLDYLIDNRNTISFTGNFSKGQFTNVDRQRIDSSLIPKPTFNKVSQNSDGLFKNSGLQLSFKHLFEKPGHEWSFDGNYNYSKNESNNLIVTNTYRSLYEAQGFPVKQKSESGGTSKNYTFQTDYANPITENQKIEAGARIAVRDFANVNNQFFFNPFLNQYVQAQLISSNYGYTDKVYAAYGTYSLKVNKWSYQFGLRVESSTYNGTINRKNMMGGDSITAFTVNFPFAIFPSAFITYKLSDKEDIQLNYSRRVNRPNFFQLIPFPDYSDPYNISVGNAGLKPEFTNSLEISYNNNYKKGANFLVNGFFKYNTNLITRFQYLGLNPDLGKYYNSNDSVIFNTYINANNSLTYGIELTNKMPITKWWDVTANFNLFRSKINIDDPKLATLSNERTSWFAKMNSNIKFLKTWSFQLSGEYFAKTVLPQEGGRGGGGGFSGGGGGRMMFGGGNLGTAQGFIDSRYSFDIALRKDWTWKGGNSGSLTFSMNDFLRTNLSRTHSESDFLFQDSERRRDPQVARINFSYRFGKFDINLFKRKSSKDMGGGTDAMPQ